MGKRGPKAREQTPRKPVKPLPCPADLDEVARDEWKRIVAVLAKRGTLDPVDGSLILGAVTRWSFSRRMFAKANELLASGGDMLDVQRYNSMGNVAFKIYRDSLKLLRLTESKRAMVDDPADAPNGPKASILEFTREKGNHDSSRRPNDAG